MIDISKDYIIGFIEGRCSFTLNKSGNAYLFKFQINMKKSENNLTFLEELKHNLGDIGKIQIVNKKSLSYAIRKHEEIKIIIKYLGDDPFYNGKMDLYKIWKE